MIFIGEREVEAQVSRFRVSRFHVSARARFQGFRVSQFQCPRKCRYRAEIFRTPIVDLDLADGVDKASCIGHRQYSVPIPGAPVLPMRQVDRPDWVLSVIGIFRQLETIACQQADG